MTSLSIIIVITVGLIIYGFVEYAQHQRNLKRIPIRIHINGTRGKSSVTRLVGAGLRTGGYETITKVTGTFPRMIMSDGTEVAIHRKEKANILEQLNIVKYCAQKKADVLLIECMALVPRYQQITEHQMIKATHGVITNIRMDHLDVMGPRLEDVAHALSKTVPKKTKLFTAEDRMTPFLERKAKANQSEFIQSKEEEVSKEEMIGFTYFEHPENVALALAICSDLGVDRSEALKAMKKTIPDEGALRKYTIKLNDHPVHFYNALAANDPESSVMLWHSIQQMEGKDKHYKVLINARKDRKERSEQLVHAAATLEFDGLFLTGENVELVRAMALKQKMESQKIALIGQGTPEEQIRAMLPSINKETVIVAFGNMGAGGAELSKYFENQHNAQ